MINVTCEHPQTDHEHGTHACYVLDQCRCAECSAANAAYERSRAVWLSGVKPHPYTDADPARAIVKKLNRKGMGLKTIASESGVAHGTLWKLIYGVPGRGPSKRVRRSTLSKLANVLDGFAFDDYTLADGAKVPAREAWEIVDELVARGWAKAEIGRRITGPQAASLQMGRRQVLVSTLRTLRELMCEPVPKRMHNPTGTYYIPQSDHTWKEVRRRVDGVGGPVYFASKGVIQRTPAPR